MKHIVSRMSSYFPNRWPLSYLYFTKNMKTYIRRQQHKKFIHQNIKHEALTYLLDIYIRSGTKIYRQTVGIPMGTNCAPLVADLLLFCYESDFMKSLSDSNQADIIEAFNSTSRYLDDLLNIDNPYFDRFDMSAKSILLSLN